MSRVSGTSFVVGRSTQEGNIDDVRIYTAASGLNYIDIARDARDVSPRTYIVDRRLITSQGGGPWGRLLRVESFSEGALPDQLSEVRAMVEMEEIPNYWGIKPNRTWGLPAGMESPWVEPIEMVGNELLLPERARWVSGDAPVNITRNNFFSNGRYGVKITNNNIDLTDEYTGDLITSLATDTRGLFWVEGVAGAAFFDGGNVLIEPAKPPIFMGSFALEYEPLYRWPGIYEYGDAYLLTSNPVMGQTYTGLFAVVRDPFPERWLPRILCRSYVKLISPAYSPPLVEEEPQRISVRAERVPTDFRKLVEPKAVTPYANKTGVFNSWEIDTPGVILDPRERPYDLLLPFDKLEDWGGHPVWTPGDYFPALDKWGKADASFPTDIAYEMPDIPECRSGTIFFRWKESAYFNIIRTDWLDVFFKEGWVYFENKVSPTSNGIYELDVKAEWNDTKIEWGKNQLFVNDYPALIEERPWMHVLYGEDETAPEIKWGQVMDIPITDWERNLDYPVDVEQYEEVPVDWVTGKPEGEAERPDPDYDATPRPWGRVLYEPFDVPS